MIPSQPLQAMRRRFFLARSHGKASRKGLTCVSLN
jgi:hypothetical protein